MFFLFFIITCVAALLPDKPASFASRLQQPILAFAFPQGECRIGSFVESVSSQIGLTNGITNFNCITRGVFPIAANGVYLNRTNSLVSVNAVGNAFSPFVSMTALVFEMWLNSYSTISDESILFQIGSYFSLKFYYDTIVAEFQYISSGILKNGEAIFNKCIPAGGLFLLHIKLNSTLLVDNVPCTYIGGTIISSLDTLVVQTSEKMYIGGSFKGDIRYFALYNQIVDSSYLTSLPNSDPVMLDQFAELPQGLTSNFLDLNTLVYYDEDGDSLNDAIITVLPTVGTFQSSSVPVVANTLITDLNLVFTVTSANSFSITGIQDCNVSYSRFTVKTSDGNCLHASDPSYSDLCFFHSPCVINICIRDTPDIPVITTVQRVYPVSNNAHVYLTASSQDDFMFPPSDFRLHDTPTTLVPNAFFFTNLTEGTGVGYYGNLVYATSPTECSNVTISIFNLVDYNGTSPFLTPPYHICYVVNQSVPFQLGQADTFFFIVTAGFYPKTDSFLPLSEPTQFTFIRRNNIVLNCDLCIYNTVENQSVSFNLGDNSTQNIILLSIPTSGNLYVNNVLWEINMTMNASYTVVYVPQTSLFTRVNGVTLNLVNDPLPTVNFVIQGAGYKGVTDPTTFTVNIESYPTQGILTYTKTSAATTTFTPLNIDYLDFDLNVYFVVFRIQSSHIFSVFSFDMDACDLSAFQQNLIVDFSTACDGINGPSDLTVSGCRVISFVGPPILAKQLLSKLKIFPSSDVRSKEITVYVDISYPVSILPSAVELGFTVAGAVRHSLPVEIVQTETTSNPSYIGYAFLADALIWVLVAFGILFLCICVPAGITTCCLAWIQRRNKIK